MGPKIFGFKNIFGPKILGSKISLSKKIRGRKLKVQKNFGQKNIKYITLYIEFLYKAYIFQKAVHIWPQYEKYAEA